MAKNLADIVDMAVDMAEGARRRVAKLGAQHEVVRGFYFMPLFTTAERQAAEERARLRATSAAGDEQAAWRDKDFRASILRLGAGHAAQLALFSGAAAAGLGLYYAAGLAATNAADYLLYRRQKRRPESMIG